MTAMLTGSFGRYQIISQLGRGAMGTVYQARDPVIERTVAIKTLNPDLPEEVVAEIRARFLREAQSAGRLNHPNVVTIYDVGVAGDFAYIAMEYLEGRSLRQMLDAGVTLSYDAIADIVAQIAEGLDYAGRFGIVHRDIKPANIMVTPTGVVKLTDFGVAYVPSSSMTQAGTALGSPKYMSPEQVLGEPVDRRADIFSLGVVLYEMLMRKTPFERPEITVLALMDLIVKEPVLRVSEQNPAIPAAFDVMLARALAKRPADRYQRASQVARDLRNFRSRAAAMGSSDVTVDTGGSAPDAAADTELLQDDPTLQEERAKLLTDLDATRHRQVSGKEAQAPAVAQSALELASALSEKLHQAFDYLHELMRRVNQATPPFTVELDLIYFGRLPTVTLVNGVVEHLTRKVEDKDVIDKVTLSYRMISSQKARISTDMDSAPMLRTQLERARLKFDHREVKNDAGTPQFEAFLIECDIAAEATLRADYEARTVEIQCQNVGVLGPAKYRLGIADLDDDAVPEIGNLLLGFPSRFAGLRLPA